MKAMKTPLQIARERQRKLEQKPQCRSCPKCPQRVVINDVSYCEEPGKMLHPYLAEYGVKCPVDIRKQNAEKGNSNV